MTAFIYIIVNIIMPILVMTLVGFILGRNTEIDTKTLAKINLYVFAPALIFTRVYEADVTFGFVANVLVYILIIIVLMFVIGIVASKLLKLPKNTSKVFTNSLMFFNSGNYGIPLIELVFKNPIASTAQIFILLVQNVISFTFGVFHISSGNSSRKEAFLNMLRMPAVYVLPLVVFAKVTRLQIPDPVMIPLRYISDGFVSIALITLGVQLSEFKGGFRLKEIAASCFIRLVVSPVIGYALVLLLGVEGILAQSFILGVSLPTAVNTALIARQFDSEPEYASQIVFFSTVLSTITISAVIYLATGFSAG